MNFTDFKKSIREPADQVVFVGLGNKARGDDAAGLMFLRELQKRMEYHSSHFIQAGVNPENYLERILELHPALVIFIDAADVGKEPGEMGWIDKDDLDTARISTHAFSITMVEEYLKANQSLQVRYFGIRPESKSVSGAISASVRHQVEMFFKV